ncbi:hypothetical protein CMI40_01165 [Candidatus Pacearchaeota archaeon]|jgi:dTDP-glucose pyrophosphorylase|nr:hypothetical protein [Candidatus Pacearchaeota archaeon]|tara:strand:- start:2298 stop:4172 length:1875 start_codon:yes stop_codon:yes gene_type:complete
MKALILAGGRGSRLNEFTKNKNKSIIKLFEKPLIEYNLDQAVELEVNEIIIVVGYKKEEIITHIGEKYKGIKVSYAIQKKQKGVVNAIECGRNLIGNSDFILMLADEMVIDAKTKDMLRKFKEEDLFAICGIVSEEDKYSIGKTYTAMPNEKGRVFRLIEKPKVKINNIKGTGHIVFKNEILDYIKRTPINAFRNQRELVDLIQVAIDDSKKVYIYSITENYVNINTKEDYDLSKKMVKENNPKVLIIHNQMKYYGGAELLIVELANWMTKMGIKNDILTLSKSKKVEEELINTDIIIPENNIDLRPPGYKDIKDIFKAIKVFRKKLSEIKNNYDIINFHDFPVTWSLWPRKKPTVWFMNQPPNLWSKPNAGWFYKLLNKVRILFDRFIVRNGIDEVCVLDKSFHKQAYDRYGINSNIVYCGVNYDFFSYGNKKKAIKEYNLKEKFIVIYSGQIAEGKNTLDCVKAVEKLKNKIPNILLVLVGKEDLKYKNKMDLYIKEKKLEKYVQFIGMIDKKEKLQDLYKAANVGLFPVGKQGGWIAPFEMVSSGIPTVMSSDMGSSTVAKKHNLCIVTKEYDKAILEIYNNYSKYKKQTNKAALYIRDNLSWRQYTERMNSVLKKAWKKP